MGGRRYGEGRAPVSRPTEDGALTLNGIGRHWRAKQRREMNRHNVLKGLHGSCIEMQLIGVY